MSDNFVDRAVEQARHNAWHERAKMESGYTPDRERWYNRDVDGGVADKLAARVAELEQQVKQLEESIAWLERGQRNIATQLYMLKVKVNGPDRDDESEPQPEPVRF